jgi:hypothetical protein
LRRQCGRKKCGRGASPPWLLVVASVYGRAFMRLPWCWSHSASDAMLFSRQSSNFSHPWQADNLTRLCHLTHGLTYAQ